MAYSTDIAGSAHLFKGEASLLQDLKARLTAERIQSHAAVADTPGCAWAMARFAKDEINAPSRMSDVLGPLPVEALRLDGTIVESLRDVGIERIAQLATKPRGSLQTRFGSEVLLRLDQALGAASEVLVSLIPPEVPRCKMRFPEPFSDPENLQRVIDFPAPISPRSLNAVESAPAGSIWCSCGSITSRRPCASAPRGRTAIPNIWPSCWANGWC